MTRPTSAGRWAIDLPGCKKDKEPANGLAGYILTTGTGTLEDSLSLSPAPGSVKGNG